MATRITHTNIVLTEAGSYTHRHISEVKTAGGTVLTRSKVVSRIEAGTEEFCTRVAGKEAKVIVVKCPVCAARDYIKTTADSSLVDNLLSLPSFTP